MKRLLLILTAVSAFGTLAWVFWPQSDLRNAALDPAPLSQPLASLAERLETEQQEGPTPDGGTVALAGVVLDAAGKRIAGAQLTLFRVAARSLLNETCPVCGKPIFECADVHTGHELLGVIRAGKGQPRPLQTTLSGADGTFRFDDLPDEELDLVGHKDLLRGRSANIGGGEDQVLQLDEPAPLKVKVTKQGPASDDPDTLARPVMVAGARVSAVSMDTMRLIETTSDALGELHLDGLDEGSGVWVFAEAAGFQPYVGSIYGGAEESEIELTPPRTLMVHATVGGKPTEALITVTPTRAHPIKQQTTGGTARFDFLSAEDCEAFAATATMVSHHQTVALESEITTLDFELRSSARLLVTVVDDTGQPVESADVSASGHEGDFRNENTNQGDLVVIGPVGEGSITLEVGHADFRPWRRELDIHPGDNPIEVVLKKGVKISGKVVDSQGKPVLQALVEARAPVTAPTMGYSDEEGAFEIILDEPGEQELTASQNSVGRTTVNLTAPATDVVIRLDPRGGVRVYVHEGHKPIAGAAVAVTALGDDSRNSSGVTSEDGFATLSGFDTGKFRIGVQIADFRQPAPIELPLVVGRVTPVDIELDRGLTVHGIVVDSRGAPVPSASILTDPWTSNAFSDEAGRFVLVTLDPAASYKVTAQTDLQQSAPVGLKGATPLLHLVMKERPLINGRVVDRVTEAPLEHFTVDGRTVASNDGTFSVPALDLGDKITAEIVADGYEVFTWEGGLELGTVRLGKAKVVDGFVRDPRGTPVSGALVVCDSSGEEVTSAADGSFHFALSRFEEGVTVSARRGQLKGRVAVDLGRTLQIVLNAPTRVLGQVIDSEGHPVAGSVSIHDVQGDDEVRVEAGPDGNFTAEIAAGRWVFISRLNASGQSFQVSGPSMRFVLGNPPGSCTLSVTTGAPPDELLLLPGDAAPGAEATFEQLASVDGAVVFDTINTTRVLRAAGFRCGPYTLLARWGGGQKLQRVEVRGGSTELQLTPPVVAQTAAQ